MSTGGPTDPVYLQARLTLNRSLRGQGLGAQLPLDAVDRIVLASETAAGRLIVVDAIDETVAALYAHHGFQPVSGDPQRLVMKIATARKALDG